MKHVFLAIIIFSLSNSMISAGSCFQSLRSGISHIGQSIENIDNIPVIGKAINILPIAMLAAGLKQCPLQTMIVLAAWGAYILSQNENVRKVMDKYDFADNLRGKRNDDHEYDLDENIFVFDQEDNNDLAHNQLLGNKADQAKQLQSSTASTVQPDFL